MATATTGRVSIKIEIEETKSTDLGNSRLLHSFTIGSQGTGIVEYPDGSAAGSVDLVYSDTFSIAGASTQTYDLAGSLTSILDGSAVTFTKIYGFAVVQDTGAFTITVGAGSNPLLNWVKATGDGVLIGNLGYLVICDPTNGYAVTAGTGDILTLTSTGSVTGRVIIWGA